VLVLIVALVCGLAAGYLTGGRLRHLEHLDLRHPWLVLLAMGIQLVIFTRLGSSISESASVWAHVSSYVVLLVFVILNRRNLGVVLAGLGTLMNATVIIINGGYMPASRRALEIAGRLADSSTYNNSIIANESAHLLPLGDVMAIPAGVPFFSNVFSVGDLFIVAGVALLLATAMRTPAPVTGVQTAGTR
jgi:Family of unknown function (DUF5317)